MKQHIFFAFVGLFLVQNLNAQIAKSSLLLGGSAFFSYSNPDNFSSSFSISLSPNVGIFVTDRLVIGGTPLVSFSSSDNFNSNSFSIGAFGRYYFPTSSEKLWFFGSTRLSYGVTNFNFDQFEDQTSNTFTFSFGPGVDYFISPSVALEGLLNYSNSTTDSDQSNFNSSNIIFSVGLQIFFQKQTEN